MKITIYFGIYLNLLKIWYQAIKSSYTLSYRIKAIGSTVVSSRSRIEINSLSYILTIITFT